MAEYAGAIAAAWKSPSAAAISAADEARARAEGYIGAARVALEARQ